MLVLIVGAGLSGLGMAIALERAGIEWQILEKSPAPGGTWWENTYPGCACDIPSHLYAFSFAPHDWSRVYPGQPEILAWLRQVVAERGLAARIRFGASVEGARWDEAAAGWRVRLAGGEELVADALVSATGPLHVPRWPDAPGRARFQGPSWHSARWDHSVPLAGRRVGVIGNAASAVQFLPRVAAEAAQVTVFQRSAHWVLPRGDRPYPAWQRAALRVRPVQRLYRLGLWLWQELLFLLAFRRGSWFGRLLAWRLRRRIARLFAHDPRLARALTPDYPIGCKRALISSDYYPTLLRENVQVVAEPVTAIEERGVRTASGAHAVDVLIHATGFQPFAPGGLDVVGRAGQRLFERWGQLPRAHLGITVPGFPNFFLLLGPHSGLGHNSVVWMAECQARYVVGCLEALTRRRARWLDVREDALDRFVGWVDRRLAGRVWRDCRSWYQNEAGQVYALWPATTLRYAWATRRPRPSEFEWG